MKRLLFISMLMALFCACSSDTDFIDDSDSPINKRSEAMETGVVGIDYETYSGGSAVVNVRVKIWNSYSKQYYYLLSQDVTVTGSIGKITEVEYSFPAGCTGFFPEITIVRFLDANGNPISYPSNKTFILNCFSAWEYDQAELKVGETYSTHCLSSDIWISFDD